MDNASEVLEKTCKKIKAKQSKERTHVPDGKEKSGMEEEFRRRFP